uniref:CHY zinc finger containing protein, putative n=1 Tax=Theileria annulata TaxID=5874 RepID=A0A3B0N522_THEAN
MKDDDCFLELFKLHKMFENSFHITNPKQDNSIEKVYNNDIISINILLKPTDPDFDRTILSINDGIKINLNLHRVSVNNYPDSTTYPSEDHRISNLNTNLDHLPNFQSDQCRSGTYYDVKDISDISIDDNTLSEHFKNSIRKVLLDYISKNSKLRKYVIYESLKFLDKNLLKIYTISESVRNSRTNNVPTQGTESKGGVEKNTTTKSANSDNPWTLEEQKCLEDGLVRSKGISDPREKWLFISKMVKTRTPEECRKRFLRCREVLVKNNRTEEIKEPEQPTYSLDRTGSLSFSRLEMIKLSLGRIGTFSMDIVCLRCTDRFEVTLADLGEKTIIYSKNCQKCSVPIRCEFTPSLFFPSQLTFGNLSLLNSDFIDLNHAEFKLTCEDCETQLRIREVKIGDKKSMNCRGCFTKFLFSFGNVQFGRGEEPSRESSVKKVIKYERKTPTVKGIKVGTPLPANGTCKHYKKSFRWFRFPCCGRLFPCDTCHDEATDHKCEYANFIVCGYCSTQQAASNKVCKFCSKGCTASSSSHWEGGKGCRDGTKLSRKDSKKYKLISKNNGKNQCKVKSQIEFITNSQSSNKSLSSYLRYKMYQYPPKSCGIVECRLLVVLILFSILYFNYFVFHQNIFVVYLFKRCSNQ